MVLPNRDSKVQWLLEMLPILSPLGRCLVFVATRADCDVLTQSILQSSLFAAGDPSSSPPTLVSIHGDKDQRERNQAISQFKKHSRAILIATDVASRGLDVAGVMTVINFDAAKNLDSHVSYSASYLQLTTVPELQLTSGVWNCSTHLFPFSPVISDPSHWKSWSFAEGWGCTSKRNCIYTFNREKC